MYLPHKDSLFQKKKHRSSPYVIALLVAMIIFLLIVLRDQASGRITPLFMATPTATRTVDSYVEEAEVHFVAGDLTKTLEAFQNAAVVDPNNVDLWVELARVQVYSSSALVTTEAKYERLNEALESANRALEIEEDNSTAHAVKAFVLDWLASSVIEEDQSVQLLTQAEQEAVSALQLDSNNTLALAYYAEILVDQLKWTQAQQYIEEALTRDDSLMDVHRINGYLQESIGNYSAAITSYKLASEINPNLTFLYLSIGVNYRELEQYDYALDYFATAADINERLGIVDPSPYQSIAKTYVQQGQFLSASLNARKAVQLKPDDAYYYAFLGDIYHKARNYESEILAFQCGLEGCTAEESCEVRQCDEETDTMVAIEGLPLTVDTKDYYAEYGAVLAALHRESNGYCEKAMEILTLVRRAFSSDTIIMGVVEESEAICESYGY
jgi:tetratricopeptide (TPR) repeat protein